MAVGALVDLHAVPFPGDQVVPALGTLHVVRPALRLGGRPAHRLALLAQQLGVAPREVLFLVLARLVGHRGAQGLEGGLDRKSTRLNSSHLVISYAVFCLKKKKKRQITTYTDLF